MEEKRGKTIKIKYFILGLLICLVLFFAGTYLYWLRMNKDVASTFTYPDGTVIDCYLNEYGDLYVYDEKGDKLYMYTYPDGSVIEYYLNEHDIPYTYIDGEQVYVVVTLDRYVVKDPDEIAALNGNGDLTAFGSSTAEKYFRWLRSWIASWTSAF